MKDISTDDEPEDETECEGTEPCTPLPTFRQDYTWPAPLDKILSFGKTPHQRGVLLLGALTVLGPSLSLIVRACTAANGSTPACKPSWWRLPQPAKACWYGCESEADIVSTAIKGEYGNWSDTLRKAFDQDRLSYNRRTEVKNRGMADKGMLFAEMPQEFTRQELLEKAKEKGISRNSTLCWLQRWKKKGVVACTGVPGTYIKK